MQNYAEKKKLNFRYQWKLTLANAFWRKHTPFNPNTLCLIISNFVTFSIPVQFGSVKCLLKPLSWSQSMSYDWF